MNRKTFRSVLALVLVVTVVLAAANWRRIRAWHALRTEWDPPVERESGVVEYRHRETGVVFVVGGRES